MARCCAPFSRRMGPGAASPDAHQRCADQFRRLCAAGFRRHLPGHRDGARCAADVAQHSRPGGAGKSRPAGLHARAAECRCAHRVSQRRRGAVAAGGAGRAGHQRRRHRHALCRHRRRRPGAGAAGDRRHAGCSGSSPVRACCRLVPARHLEGCGAAGRLGDGAGIVAGPPHRLQDRHLLWLSRCLGGGFFQRLHRGGVGGPRRRHAAPRPHRPRSRRPDPAQDVRPAAARYAAQSRATGGRDHSAGDGRIAARAAKLSAAGRGSAEGGHAAAARHRLSAQWCGGAATRSPGEGPRHHAQGRWRPRPAYLAGQWRHCRQLRPFRGGNLSAGG